MSNPDGERPFAVQVWVNRRASAVLLWIKDPRLGEDWAVRKDPPNAAHDASRQDIQEHAHVYRRVWGKGKGKRVKGLEGKWRETHVIRKDGSVSHPGRTGKKSGDAVPPHIADVLRDHDYQIRRDNLLRFTLAEAWRIIQEVTDEQEPAIEWLIVVVGSEQPVIEDEHS